MGKRIFRIAGSTTIVSALILCAAGAGVPATATDAPSKQELEKIYEETAEALANAANPEPKPNPLTDLLPQPGGPLESSISELQSDLKDFLPKLGETDDDAPNLINQNPGSLNSNQLNITVAKSLLVSADASGNSLMNVLLASTQVSGGGAATVKVPMGTENASNSSGFRSPTMQGQSIVYDVDNAKTNIQNFGASNSSYHGDLPIKIDVAAWVNGERVEPQNMINVSGQVKLSYTFTNTTSEPTQISFRGPDGGIITQTKEIPVPFGGAFLITLPSTFADINAPWAQGGVSPLGTTLSGTVMMIPPIGKTTQTLTIEARADRASLPPSSFQALPVTLTDQGIGKMVFEGLPIAGDITNVAVAGAAFGAADIVKLQALVMKYGAVAEGISNRYVRPFIKAFEDGTVDKAIKYGEDQIVQLDDGAKQLGQLLPQAQLVIGLIDKYLKLAVETLEKNVTNIEAAARYLAEASAAFDKMLPQIDKTIEKVVEFLPTAVEKGLQLAKVADNICGETATLLPQIEPFQDDIAAALNLLKAGLGDKFLSWMLEIEKDVPLCITYADEAIKYLEAASVNMPTILAGLQRLDSAINFAAKKLDQGVITVDNFVEKTLPGLIYQLDHNCKQSPSTISQCGVMQQIDFLNQMMILAAKTVNSEMVPGLNFVVEFLPTINKFVGLADTYIPIFGKKLEAMIPAAIAGAEGGLESGLTAIDKFGAYAAKAEITVASMTAQLEVMNARAQSGQGLPAGPAQGANTNLGAYQYQLAGASDQGRQNAILFGAAALLLVFSAGVGTVLYSRHRP